VANFAVTYRGEITASDIFWLTIETAADWYTGSGWCAYTALALVFDVELV
jgi:hypothetical protein